MFSCIAQPVSVNVKGILCVFVSLVDSTVRQAQRQQQKNRLHMQFIRSERDGQESAMYAIDSIEMCQFDFCTV